MNEPAKKDQEVTDVASEVGMETESEIEVSKNTDNVGEISVEINVEELIANIENENDEDAARKKEIRRRLEEVAEEQSLEDTYAIDLSDDD